MRSPGSPTAAPTRARPRESVGSTRRSMSCSTRSEPFPRIGSASATPRSQVTSSSPTPPTPDPPSNFHLLFKYSNRIFPMDKKLIAAFRTFVDRVFLPSLKKTDQAFFEWTKFNQLLSVEANAYDEAAQYAESLNGSYSSSAISSIDKRDVPLFKKRALENEANNPDAGFNPSKTFGGERARMIFMKGDADDSSEQRQPGFGFGPARTNDDPTKRGQINPQAILPGLEKLCRTFVENQGRIDNILNAVRPARVG